MEAVFYHLRPSPIAVLIHYEVTSSSNTTLFVSRRTRFAARSGIIRTSCRTCIRSSSGATWRASRTSTISWPKRRKGKEEPPRPPRGPKAKPSPSPRKAPRRLPPRDQVNDIEASGSLSCDDDSETFYVCMRPEQGEFHDEKQRDTEFSSLIVFPLQRVDLVRRRMAKTPRRRRRPKTRPRFATTGPATFSRNISPVWWKTEAN